MKQNFEEINKETNKQINNLAYLIHNLYLTTSGDAVASAWIAFSKATKFSIACFENHLSFHVKGSESGFLFTSTQFSVLPDFSEGWNSDVYSKSKMTKRLSEVSITCKNKAL